MDLVYDVPAPVKTCLHTSSIIIAEVVVGGGVAVIKSKRLHQKQRPSFVMNLFLIFIPIKRYFEKILSNVVAVVVVVVVRLLLFLMPI